MKRLPDAEIINSLGSTNSKERDETLTYLYKKMYRVIGSFILRNKGTEVDAEDIFQDGLLALYKLIIRGKLQSTTNVEAYLFSICRNLWLKQLEKRFDTVEVAEEVKIIAVEDVKIKTLVSGDKKNIIDQLLNLLGKDCKQILLYYYYEHLKLKDIVHLMHYTSEQVVKNKKSTCMKKLRELLDNHPEIKKKLKFD